MGTRQTTLPVLVLAALALGLASASAQELQSQLEAKQSRLGHRQERQGVLSTEISRYGEEIDRLAGEVALLRNREALVAEELRRVQSRLRSERDRLEALRQDLRRSLSELRERLVQIYRSGAPDVMTVILNSDGFDDLLSRYEYLRRIEEQDATVVGRVRGLRNTTRITVGRIAADRDQVAAKKAELERTRTGLEAREAELSSARDRQAAALDQVEGSIKRLEGNIGEIEEKIQAQLQATTSPSSASPIPAGPIQGQSSSGFIWPVQGTLSSPFGQRWGRLHAGIDIAAPGGTPIQAAADGTIVLAEPYGGYGNYTCVDHGAGLSTCYAHQSAFELTSGPVKQGQVIGYVGNTGASFGDHLHFEVRVSGNPVDPLGYL